MASHGAPNGPPVISAVGLCLVCVCLCCFSGVAAMPPLCALRSATLTNHAPEHPTELRVIDVLRHLPFTHPYLHLTAHIQQQ